MVYFAFFIGNSKQLLKWYCYSKDQMECYKFNL